MALWKRAFESGSSDESNHGRGELAILECCRLFDDVPARLKADLAADAAIRSWHRGQLLFKAGDPVEFLHIVDEGLVRTYQEVPSGREVTFAILAHGDVLVIPAPSRQVYPATAKAMGAVRCLCVPAKAFLSCLTAHSGLALATIGFVCGRLGEQSERNIFYLSEPVEVRIRRCLHLLSRRLGPLLTVTSKELAGYADTTPETTIRVLSRLKRLGLVERGKGGGLLVKGGLMQEGLCS